MHDTYELAKDKMSGGSDAPPKRIKHIITKKVHGGHVHTHVHDHPMHPDEDHVTTGTDGMIGHMLDHSSDPNPGEAEADAGQSGIPSPSAAPAAGVGPSAAVGASV